MPATSSRYSVSLEYQAVKLPPVRDILVLAKKFPHGKAGVMESFRFIAPDEFEMFDIPEPEEVAEAVLINKRILARMPADDVISILRAHVFPHICRGEAVNVDLNVKVHVEGIELSRDRP